MADRVFTVSNLIHRAVSSCLTNPIIAGATAHRLIHGDENIAAREEDDHQKHEEREDEEQEYVSEKGMEIWEAEEQRMRDMEVFMADVFNAVSAVKKAYVGFQQAHCPWDPDKVRVADASVVAELRKLSRLRDRFRRGTIVGAVGGGPPLREVVAPYEAALEDLRRELKVKEAEIENLKEKLRCSTPRGRGGMHRHRIHSSTKIDLICDMASPAAPTAELFQSYIEVVKSASKSFTAHLLSLMRAARWDLAAAARAITQDVSDGVASAEWGNLIPDVEPQHARFALESYVNWKLFQGFENETFYLEGSLKSLLSPADFRRDCFSQYRDMRRMDPAELLGILPTCQFGRFAANKYLAVVHPKMEDSLFGGTDQRETVVADGHPRTVFYREFLSLAKAVWLLHLLAFALDPPPSHFEASKGAEFHPEYMDSVVRFDGGMATPPGAVVGFSVAPGFKLASGSVLRARVFLVLPDQDGAS
ncbi:hypothetical protein AXF42_Ash015372 [Apostasia shenzhenica]|uniref:Uncharacterized protein n=1 Tax=Apostasia shenzhenica TaxID=1088818 RepID=A0A2H9ZS14_9ASPA|nr:hypothetical protein AXF42_Ash015372 [Apostasia shenzhenica]